MVSRIRLIGACLLLSIMALPAMAGSLNLTLLDFPDLTSGFTDVSYAADTDLFSATGWALSLDDDGAGAPVNIDNGTFDITAVIDDQGVPVSGALTITGNVLAHGPTLLTGSLTAFGYLDGGGDIFEFLFDVTGGDLAIPSLYGSPGSVPLGVIMDATGSNFGGTFDVDFDNNGGMPGWGNGVSDTAPVPEPGSFVLLLVAVAFGRAGARRA